MADENDESDKKKKLDADHPASQASSNEEDSAISGEDIYKARLAALEKLANPVSASALAAIRKLKEQQSEAANLYKQKSRFPGISDLMRKAGSDHLKSIRELDKNSLAGSKRLTESIQKIVNQGSNDVRSVATSPRKDFKVPEDLLGFEKEKREKQRQQQEFDKKVGIATLEQTKHLSRLSEQNTILVNAITELLNHTVRFETEKSHSSKNQYDISVWALWAAVISAVISLCGLSYSIFWQKAPQVTVSPPQVNVTPAPINFEPVTSQLQTQTKELQKMNRALRSKSAEQKRLKPEPPK